MLDECPQEAGGIPTVARCLPFLGDVALLSSIMLGQQQSHGDIGLSTYL